MRAAEKPPCSTCRKLKALHGKEPDCESCIVKLEGKNSEVVAVYNTTIAIKNLGLESIFEVMRMLKTKDKISTVALSIRLAAELKEKQEREKQPDGR